MALIFDADNVAPITPDRARESFADVDRGVLLGAGDEGLGVLFSDMDERVRVGRVDRDDARGDAERVEFLCDELREAGADLHREEHHSLRDGTGVATQALVF
ncbi:MAG: hypothetical protein R3B68_02900 [Phycisphaerales bacterium]